MQKQAAKPLPKLKVKLSVWLKYGITCLVFITSNLALALEVVRGPYLQRATSDAIIIKWRTDDRSDSVVRYGTSVNNLNQQVVNASNTRNHRVELNNLSPETTYYYSVGSPGEVLAGGTTAYRFKTAPPLGTATATRIWVIGDAGTANSNQRRVYNAYLNYPGQENTALWLMLGDNAYNSGTDSEYQSAVFDVYQDLLRRAPVWSTLGNHDGYSADSATLTGPYYNIFSFPRNAEAGGVASGTEAYYSFDYGNIHFICLDSYETDRSVNGAMLTWLRNDLAATNQPWIITFFHHPPYSKGSHDTDSSSEYRSFEMRERALPILEQYGVDLVLSGHSHSYERSYLIDGHYGRSNTFGSQHQVDAGDGRIGGDGAYQKPLNSSNSGTVYSVAGASGKTSGVGNHAAMFLALNELGSLVLDVNDDQLDVRYLNDSGQVRDRFTLMKASDNGGGNPPPLGSQLLPGEQLNIGDSLISSNGAYRLVFQSDGNLVLYAANGTVIWASGTQGSGADRFVFQRDGNLVIYRGSEAIWSSASQGSSATALVLKDNGSLVLYDGTDVVWSAGNAPPDDDSSGGALSVVNTTSSYSPNDKLNLALPNNTQADDLLMLFLSRTDDLLPLRLNGWQAGAACFKTTNGQSSCHEIPDCIEFDGDYCLRFDGGRGRDLATVVFYKTALANEPDMSFNLRGNKPTWAILTTLRGANNQTPIYDVNTASNDRSPDSRFPSVNGPLGGLLLLSMAFDDTTARDDFLAPSGMSTLQWIAGSDEAGYLYAQSLAAAGATGERVTRGPGGPNAKDALIALTVQPKNDDTGGNQSIRFERSIISGSDDVEQRANGAMYVNSSDLELVYDNGNQIVGLRFTNIELPARAQIESAYIQFTVDESNSQSTQLAIRIENSDSAAAFATQDNALSQRDQSSKFVSWQPQSWTSIGAQGADQRTPNLAELVQDVVNRPQWQSGNNLAFFISGNGERTAQSFEKSASNAARLMINYRMPEQNNQPQVIEAETYQASADVRVANNHDGYFDTGFVDYGGLNAWAEWPSLDVAKSGRYRITFRYANRDSMARPMQLSINNRDISEVAFTPTQSWTDWQSAELEVDLASGANDIKLTVSTVEGGPNLDRIIVTPIE